MLEESITRRFDTPLWFLTLGNSTEFQVTVNLSKPFPICPSLLLCRLFAHLKDCVPCLSLCVCMCVRERKRCKNGLGNIPTFLSNKFFSFISSKLRKHLEEREASVDITDEMMEVFLIIFPFSPFFSVSDLFSGSASVHVICKLLLNLH